MLLPAVVNNVFARKSQRATSFTLTVCTDTEGEFEFLKIMHPRLVNCNCTGLESGGYWWYVDVYMLMTPIMLHCLFCSAPPEPLNRFRSWVDGWMARSELARAPVITVSYICDLELLPVPHFDSARAVAHRLTNYSNYWDREGERPAAAPRQPIYKLALLNIYVISRRHRWKAAPTRCAAGFGGGRGAWHRLIMILL